MARKRTIVQLSAGTTRTEAYADDPSGAVLSAQKAELAAMVAKRVAAIRARADEAERVAMKAIEVEFDLAGQDSLWREALTVSIDQALDLLADRAAMTEVMAHLMATGVN